MVDSQLRPNKVSNPILLDAMRQVPRETFLPPPLWSVAYADQDVRLGGGRALIAPLAFRPAGTAAGPRAGRARTGGGLRHRLWRGRAIATCGARVTALDQDRVACSTLGGARSAPSA